MSDTSPSNIRENKFGRKYLSYGGQIGDKFSNVHLVRLVRGLLICMLLC